MKAPAPNSGSVEKIELSHHGAVCLLRTMTIVVSAGLLLTLSSCGLFDSDRVPPEVPGPPEFKEAYNAIVADQNDWMGKAHLGSEDELYEVLDGFVSPKKPLEAQESAFMEYAIRRLNAQVPKPFKKATKRLQPEGQARIEQVLTAPKASPAG